MLKYYLVINKREATIVGVANWGCISEIVQEYRQQ
jgi:hypothetical protein